MANVREPAASVSWPIELTISGAESPRKVRVLLPPISNLAPEGKAKAPVPLAKIEIVPVVPWRPMIRSVLWPAPVYRRPAPLVIRPIRRMPFSTVVGAPSELAPPPTFAMLSKTKVPAVTSVVPA